MCKDDLFWPSDERIDIRTLALTWKQLIERCLHEHVVHHFTKLNAPKS